MQKQLLSRSNFRSRGPSFIFRIAGAFFFRQLGCNLVRWYSQLQANTMKTINLWKIEHLASWRSQINLSFALVSSSSILVKSLQIWICATTFDTVLQAPVNVTCEDCPQLLLKQSHKANPSLCILIQQCWIVTYVLFFLYHHSKGRNNSLTHTVLHWGSINSI